MTQGTINSINNTSGDFTVYNLTINDGTIPSFSTLNTDGTGKVRGAGPGSIGQVLTSTGPTSAPIFQTPGSTTFVVNIQAFLSSGTYTPTGGMAYCIVEVLGGGAGGGFANGGSTVSAGGGGGAGEYRRGYFSAATIGASQTITIGAGGTGSFQANTPGQNGGNTSFGSLMTAFGGSGGLYGAGSTTSSIGNGSPGGSGGAGGTFFSTGGQGETGFCIVLAGSQVGIGGQGGNSVYGGGGRGFNNASGENGQSHGSGGAGGCKIGGGTANGGNGSAGCIIVTEYIL